MRAVVSIEHPAWAHQFRWIIGELQRLGHEVLVLAIDKDNSFALLRDFGIPYVPIAPTTGVGLLQKAWLLLLTTWRMYWHCRRFRPDVFFGRASPMLAINSRLLSRPHILFEDTEHSRFSLAVCRLCSTVIMTPRHFKRDLGPKQRRLETFKELFYLHPKIFSAKETVPLVLGLVPGSFIFVRFVAWNGSHDFGLRGLSDQAKHKLVRELESVMPVVVSCEGEVPQALLPYMPHFPLKDVHHLLAHAALYVGEGASMASEAAVLGTYAIYINPQTAGSLETQQRFGLVAMEGGPDRYARALDQARAVLADPDRIAKCAAARQTLLAQCCDGGAAMLKLVLASGESETISDRLKV